MTGAVDRPHRGTIFLEDSRVISQESWPDGQHVLRLSAPKCARHATPGSFAHVRCAADLPMRRPLSIQRADPEAGCTEVASGWGGVGRGGRGGGGPPPPPFALIGPFLLGSLCRPARVLG